MSPGTSSRSHTAMSPRPACRGQRRSAAGGGERAAVRGGGGQHSPAHRRGARCHRRRPEAGLCAGAGARREPPQLRALQGVGRGAALRGPPRRRRRRLPARSPRCAACHSACRHLDDTNSAAFYRRSSLLTTCLISGSLKLHGCMAQSGVRRWVRVPAARGRCSKQGRGRCSGRASGRQGQRHEDRDHHHPRPAVDRRLRRAGLQVPALNRWARPVHISHTRASLLSGAGNCLQLLGSCCHVGKRAGARHPPGPEEVRQ